MAIINHGRIAAIDTPERLKRAFQRVQSVEVALEPDGQAHGQPLAALPGVTTSVKMGDKWRLYTEDPSALLPQVMDYARSQRLRMVSLNTLSPSLLAYLSPLTYAQDLMNHAVQGIGLLNPWLDLAMLLLTGILFLLPSVKMHQRSRKLGY